MLAAAIVCLGCGAPFVALGFHLNKKASEPPKQKKKGTKKQKKPKASGTSFIIGGGLLSLIGIAFAVAHFAK